MDNQDLYQYESENQFSEDLPSWLSEYSTQLPGWPGYRTQSKRSGYDPLDTYAEYGHIQGILLRDVINLRLQAKNIFTKILLVCASLIYLTPLIFIIGEFYHNIFLMFLFIFMFSPHLTLGILLTINLIINFRKKEELIASNI